MMGNIQTFCQCIDHGDRSVHQPIFHPVDLVVIHIAVCSQVTHRKIPFFAQLSQVCAKGFTEFFIMLVVHTGKV